MFLPCGETVGFVGRGRPLLQAGQRQALAHALNGACRGCSTAQSFLDLIRAEGGMPFADRLYLCLCDWRQAVVWLMRATLLVCECFVQGLERASLIGIE